jgi:Family of unknown function (DUF6272)
MQTGTLNIDTKQILSSFVGQMNESGMKNITLAHIGGVNQDLINSLSTNVEDFMISAGDKKPLIKRIFSIVIEGLQNVLIHGERIDGNRLGLLVIASNENVYRVAMGNITLSTDHEKITTYLDRLNHLNEEEVKAFYLETLNNGLISAKGGAGLGFITMRMKSKNRLDYSFLDLGEGLSFFSITTELER